jgi:hypothetical protein
VDVDGLQGPDVVAVNWLSNTFSLFLQSPRRGRFALVRKIPTKLELPYGLYAADLDGDGAVDLAATGLVGAVYVVYGDGTGGFSDGQVVRVGAGARWVWGADLDGNGRLDLFTADTHDGKVSVVRSLGPRRYAPAQSFFSGRLVRMVRAADLDEDGRLDLVVANQGEDDLTLLFQRGPGEGRPCPDPTE